MARAGVRRGLSRETRVELTTDDLREIEECDRHPVAAVMTCPPALARAATRSARVGPGCRPRRRGSD
jgi:hypothetical protein